MTALFAWQEYSRPLLVLDQSIIASPSYVEGCLTDEDVHFMNFVLEFFVIFSKIVNQVNFIVNLIQSIKVQEHTYICMHQCFLMIGLRQ